MECQTEETLIRADARCSCSRILGFYSALAAFAP